MLTKEHRHKAPLRIEGKGLFFFKKGVEKWLRKTREWMYSEEKGDRNLVLVVKHITNVNSGKGSIWMQKPKF